MNVTELARILKVNPQELRDHLPEMGFDVGQKAIKVDNRTAQQIIKEWPRYKKRLEIGKQLEEQKTTGGVEGEEIVKKKIAVPQFITVREFSQLTEIPVNKVLSELMKNGIFASMNEKIDHDTATIIGSDLGFDISLSEEGGESDKKEIDKLKIALEQEDKSRMKIRPPVIVVMGHVDHGKTKLLDAIRKTNVIEGEAGGITQHVGAYQVMRQNRLITFIDTPGHEAFTAMRSRGAKVADVAILVVAADDGVKPQTVEAYRIIETAKIPFVVAINKIDKPEADINKTKQELATQLNIRPEDWGGKIICAPISAKAGTGVEELLDMILLTADMEEKNMQANPGAKALGTIIESNIHKGAGPVATILIQNGTLRVGDQLTFDGQIYGKVRALRDYKGEDIKEAPPSTPTQILGLKILPEVGDMLQVGEGERVKGKKTKSNIKHPETKHTVKSEKEEQKKRLNLIIKSDVFGSTEAIEESLEKISTEDVGVNIIHKGLGNITEGGIEKAEASNAQILGFNVKVPPQLENVIREKNITVKTFNIIYDLIQYVKEQLQDLAGIEIQRVDLGRLKVAAIFRTEKNSQIIGGKVLEGNLENNSLIEVIRDKEIIANGKLVRLQSGKQNVDKVEKDQECGLQYEGKPIVEEGDILQIYKEEQVIKSL